MCKLTKTTIYSKLKAYVWKIDLFISLINSETNPKNNSFSGLSKLIQCYPSPNINTMMIIERCRKLNFKHGTIVHIIMRTTFCFVPGQCGTLVFFRNNRKNWTDARIFCQSIAMDLTIIESSTELTRVQKCVATNGGYL